MNLNEYQEAAARTAPMNVSDEIRLATFALGVAGEAGECADLVKKHLGHGHPLDKEKLKKELGDVLWYISGLAGLIGCSLEEVAQANIDKLKARYPEGFDPERSKNRVEGAEFVHQAESAAKKKSVLEEIAASAPPFYEIGLDRRSCECGHGAAGHRLQPTLPPQNICMSTGCSCVDFKEKP